MSSEVLFSIFFEIIKSFLLSSSYTFWLLHNRKSFILSKTFKVLLNNFRNFFSASVVLFSNSLPTCRKDPDKYRRSMIDCKEASLARIPEAETGLACCGLQVMMMMMIVKMMIIRPPG